MLKLRWQADQGTAMSSTITDLRKRMEDTGKSLREVHKVPPKVKRAATDWENNFTP